jgi:hypothetical protein
MHFEPINSARLDATAVILGTQSRYRGLRVRFRSCALFALLGLLLAAAPLSLAHHSVAGEFDMHKTVTLKGVVSKVDWINPHIYVYLDVKGQHDAVETWKLESAPIAMARKAGLSKAMLMGNAEMLTVDVFPARDGTQHLGFILKINFADGHVYQFSPDTRDPPAR